MKTAGVIIGITAAVIVVIIAAAVIFAECMTVARDEGDERAVAVGGMVKSDSVEYKSEKARGLEKDGVIKMMQVFWKFCNSSDIKKHEKQSPPQDITAIYDKFYIDDGNIYHMLDIYYPEEVSEGERLPVVIDIHGGGWMYGDKNLNENYCRAIASRGYAVISISYRLVPDVTVGEQIQDVMQALKWIGEHGEEYPCDMGKVMLTGDSAGGQLASYAAILLQSEELRGIFGTVGAEIEVDALVLTSPVAYMKEGMMSIYTKKLWGKGYKDEATYGYMNLDEVIGYAKMPPTYLITSSGDMLAHEQTVKAAKLIEQTGSECELADYGKVNGKKLVHVFSVLEPFDEVGREAIDKALNFFESRQR